MQFIDLKAQYASMEDEIRAAMNAVLEHGQYIMGPEVHALEAALSEYTGAKHSIATASGTDSLLMALMAYGVKPGDAIITTPFTFVATAEVIQLLGATTVFVDIDEQTYNLDPAKVAEAAARVKKEGKYNLRGMIPVDLFGLPADHAALAEIAAEHDLFIIDDAAQAFGGEYQGQRLGSLGDIATTSFFPAKPLGCYGDGGAVFTNNDELAALLRSIRVHGMGDHRYDNVRTGITGRMDSVQAAVLNVKLKTFEDEIVQRQVVAQRYDEALEQHFVTPKVAAGYRSAWAQYTLRHPERERIMAELKEQGIPTMIYYPKGLHNQLAFKNADGAGVSMPITDRMCDEVFSLPMHPFLSADEQGKVVDALLNAIS